MSLIDDGEKIWRIYLVLTVCSTTVIGARIFVLTGSIGAIAYTLIIITLLTVTIFLRWLGKKLGEKLGRE